MNAFIETIKKLLVSLNTIAHAAWVARNQRDVAKAKKIILDC
jgi:hypothetical protein